MSSLSILLLLIAVFFVTSVIGVVTGSNSLIAVPVMFQVGIDEKVAIATNMFALTFMAIGGSIPFLREGKIDLSRTQPLIILTILGSALGAILVGKISERTVRLIVTAGMLAVVVFTIFAQNSSRQKSKDEKSSRLLLGLLSTFGLAIYGGLFSGGYVTILTAVFVSFFGMSYAESVGTTKLVNLFSSLVATAVFIWQGLVDYRLGLILGLTMFVGAFAGASLAVQINEKRLRQIFLTAVFLLSLKMLYDLTYQF
ncbi:MAG: sulfite exporter TauE/SafE family protein [Blastocatellia bacterium]